MSLALLSVGLVRTHRALFRRHVWPVSPFIQGNLLAEARCLNRAGYPTAAVITARVAVERRLRQMAVGHPKFKRDVRGIQALTMFLRAVGKLKAGQQREINAFSKRANAVVHGEPVNRVRATSIIRQAAMVAAMLKGGAA